MSEPRLILASSSPRRAFFLKQLGYRFRKVAPEVDETPRNNEGPRQYVRRLAIEKAMAVAHRHRDSWVLAADTTVVVKDRLLGKPEDAKTARQMLRQLSGRRHRVLSAVAITHLSRSIAAHTISSTRVDFRGLSEKEIRWYVDTEEPLDKAGAYAIQGNGGYFVSRIEGSYSNVIGFPLEAFYELQQATGFPAPPGL